MNAIDLLKQDHEKVDKLFKEAKANEAADNTGVFKTIKAELDAHAHIEETIFYPRLLKDGNEELQKIVNEGIEEHRQMKMFLGEIDALTNDSDKFDAKLKVLMEDTEHHVKEEESEMFSLAKSQLGNDVLAELGSKMEAERMKFTKSAKASA